MRMASARLAFAPTFAVRDRCRTLMFEATTIHSRKLNNERRLWLQRPIGDAASRATLFLRLDAECYVHQMESPVLIATLQDSGRLPPCDLCLARRLSDTVEFRGALCQSASFWWSENSLIRDVLMKAQRSLRLRISCGSQETAELVDHGHGIVQRSSQLASNRVMRDALSARRHHSYEEFDGGHDLAAWRKDLPISLAALFS
jgi:enterochelin esterase-like enzyme